MAKYGKNIYGKFIYGTGVIDRTQKRYIYKVYDDNLLVKVWTSEVLSEPSFATNINSSVGQLKVLLLREFEDFGEDVDVKLGNRIDVICFDVDNADGLLVYRGFISAYSPVLKAGVETINITVLPFFAQASYIMLREADTDTTTIEYISADPSDMLTNILSKFRVDGGIIDTAGGSVDLTSLALTYTLTANTVLEAVNKVVSLAPANWYWRISPDNIFYFKEVSSSVDHDLNIGEQIVSMKSETRSENIINRVYVTGGGSPPLYKVYEKADSISTYGLHAKKIVNQGITTNVTAQSTANRLMNENQEPEVRLALTIIDNNGRTDDHGYDIESISVGQTIRVKNLKYGLKSNSLWNIMKWNDDVWNYTLSSVAGQPLTIVKTSYKPNVLEVVTSSKLPVLSKRVEGVGTSLGDTQTKDNPTSPT